MSTPADHDHLISTARRLVEPVRGMAGQLRGLLDQDGAVLPFPSSGTPGEVPEGAFVDGAVAHEQSDALMWVSAVGVRLAGATPPAHVAAAAVAPVSGDTDRLRAALMASCEIAAAVTADPTDTVFMDGGLATPLISVAQGLLVRDGDVAAAVRDHYDRVDLPSLVEAYVTRVAAGGVVALPKQDTATGFASEWATEYRGRFPHAGTPTALGRMRDRPLAGAILGPGEWLRPRRAVEVTRTEIKASGDGVNPLVESLRAHYERFSRTPNLAVTYIKARGLADRVIKMEYQEGAPGRWDTGRALAAVLDGVTMGPRVKEPLPQYQVDGAAKKAVTAQVNAMMQAASAAFDGDPAATSRYRT